MSLTSISWALTTLQNLGYRIQNPAPETVLTTPWSCVYRFSTHQGECYLKQVPPALSLEAEVITSPKTFLGYRCAGLATGKHSPTLFGAHRTRIIITE